MWFKRWWRWATNPPPLTHQYWFVDNIGIVVITGHCDDIVVRTLKNENKAYSDFRIKRTYFLQSATPINTCLTFNRNILGFEDKSQVELVEQLKAAYKEVASP